MRGFLYHREKISLCHLRSRISRCGNEEKAKKIPAISGIKRRNFNCTGESNLINYLHISWYTIP